MLLFASMRPLRGAIEDLPDPLSASSTILGRQLPSDFSCIASLEGADDAPRTLGYLEYLGDFLACDSLGVTYSHDSKVPVDAMNTLNLYLPNILLGAEWDCAPGESE